MRFLKQQAWDDKKRGRKNSESSAPSNDSSRRFPKLNMNAKEKKVVPVRSKICKRCGSEYDPNGKDPQGCRWHNGRFVAMDEAGTFVNTNVGTNRDFERRAQSLI